MTLSTVASEFEADDLEGVEIDLPSLVNRFLTPIDQMRSQARPNINAPGEKVNQSPTESIRNDFKDLQLDGLRPLESRAHACFRLIGLPVVGSTSSFYNPGFDPNGSKTSSKREDINNSFFKNFPDLANLIALREQRSQSQREIFAAQDLNSSIYAMLLRFPAPFQVIPEDQNPLQVNPQKFTVSDRQSETKVLSGMNSGLQSQILTSGNQFSSGQTILRPLIVDPRLENTVTPDLNKVCVPFLKDLKSTRISGDKYVKRPGLELIIRQRLSSSQEDLVFLKEAERIISESNSGSTTNIDPSERASLRDVLSALSDDNQINDQTRDLLSGITNLQATTLNGLLKIIKVIIKHLFQSTSMIDAVKHQINWIPILSQEGPISGPAGASLGRSGLKASSSDLDLIIAKLRIKKLNAERQANNLANLGEFASPFTANSNFENANKYTESLNDALSKRDRYAHQGFLALQDIENICGEVSGWGLVHCVSLYFALWSTSLDVLINLLDDDSFQRLYDFNPEFRGNSQVEARKNGSQLTISETLEAVERKFINVLSFADKLLEAQQLSPLERLNGEL